MNYPTKVLYSARHLLHLLPLLLIASIAWTSAVAAQDREMPEPLEPGQAVPSFEYQLLDADGTVSDESMRGQYYMIYLWSTGCGLCRQEMPALHEAYDALQGADFEIVSITLDQEADDVHDFRQNEHPMPWTHVFIGGDREEMMDIFFTFGARGTPTKVLVSPEGVVLEVISGPSGDELTERLAAHLPDRHG